jgi:RNA recognition motif-containing protein
VTKLYVGNLPFSATEDSVRALFTPHGTVESLSLITDRDTGQARGFGCRSGGGGGGGGNRGPRRF